MSNYATTSGTNKYSEDDFEYLPNGGWGTSVPTMHNTTWYNDRRGISIDTVTKGSFAGWHTLLITVSGGHVKYYVENQDGVTATLLADHSTNKGINYYPRAPWQSSRNCGSTTTLSPARGTWTWTGCTTPRTQC